jgi:hypothetical protein
MNQDRDHLKLLSIFHYILGSLAALFSCFPFLYIGLGVWFVSSPQMAAGQGEPPPPEMGWFFIGFGVLFVFVLWTVAIFLLLAGRFLSHRRHYLFCMVVAALSCLWVPFGTVLGVFTIIVLGRPTVKKLFARARSANFDASQ